MFISRNGKQSLVITSLLVTYAASLLPAVIEYSCILLHAWPVIPGVRENIMVVTVIVLLFLSAGTAWGLLQGAFLILIRNLGRHLSSRRNGFPGNATSRAFAGILLLSPLLILLTHALFSGRRISQIPHRGLILFLTTTCILTGAFLLLRTALIIVHTLKEGNLRRRVRTGLFSMSLLSVAGLYLADHTLYTGLYRYIHFTLEAGLVVMLELSWLLAFPRTFFSPHPLHSSTRRRIFTAFLLPVTGCALIILIQLPHAPPRWQQARARIYRSGTLSARLLSLIPHNTPRDIPLSRSAHSGILSPFWKEDPAMRLLENREGPAGDARGKNILLITVDALRADHLGCYGYNRDTSPHLDRLASEGIRFTNAYVPVPYSFFSILGLLSSRYGSSFLLGADVNTAQTLADILGNEGYSTGAYFPRLIFFGHNPDNPLHRISLGFNEVEAASASRERAPEICAMASSFITTHVTERFFLWVHFVEPHYPFERHKGFHFGEQAADRFDGEIAYVDNHIGQLLDVIEEKGLMEETVIAVTADHGEGLGEHGLSYHGNSLYEEQVRVGCILRVPGLDKRVIDAPVQTIDLAPTLLRLLGLPAGREMQGTDLVPLLTADLPGYEGTAFSEVVRERIEQRMVRRGPWKLIYHCAGGIHELYHLRDDPGEKVNLVGEEATATATLQHLLEQWSGYQYRHTMLLTQGDRAGEMTRVDRLITYARAGDMVSIRQLLPLLNEERSRDKPAAIIEAIGSLEGVLARWHGGRGPGTPPSLAGRAGEVIAPFLAHDNNAIRMEACRTLARLGDRRAIPPLLHLLSSGIVTRRIEAVRFLGTLDDPRAVEPLKEALVESRAEDERREIALALAKLGDPAGIDTLIAILDRGITGTDKQEVGAATEVVKSLGKLGDRRSVEPLCRVLTRGWYRNAWYGYSIIKALERIGDPAALPALREVAATTNFDPCRKAAENAIAEIEPASIR